VAHSLIVAKVRTNYSLFDGWSIIHILAGFVLTVWFGWWWAFVITTVFEAVERFGQRMGWDRFLPGFFTEGTRNRWIGDIIANVIGILIAVIFV
jgi:hypothetical protein